jgi:hypothetical protein
MPARTAMMEEATMRSKLVFSLCAVALAALLPGQRLPSSAAPGAHQAGRALCCTTEQKQVCIKFHEIAECVDGTCVCSPPWTRAAAGVATAAVADGVSLWTTAGTAFI